MLDPERERKNARIKAKEYGYHPVQDSCDVIEADDDAASIEVPYCMDCAGNKEIDCAYCK